MIFICNMDNEIININQKKLIDSKEYNYLGRFEKFLKLGFCNFYPNLKDWNDLLENSLYEMHAYKYFRDKIDSYEKLIWKNNNQINNKTSIGKISLLDEINELFYTFFNEALAPTNCFNFENKSLNSYKSFSDISFNFKRKLKAIVIISYKEIKDQTEAIAYYQGSNNNINNFEYQNLNSIDFNLEKRKNSDLRLIYPRYGEIIVLDPKLVCNFRHILDFENFYCIFYKSDNKKLFKIKNINYNSDKYKLSPHSFIDSPNISLLLRSGIFGRFKKNASNFNKYGYTKFAIKDPNWISLIDNARNKLAKYINKNNIDIKKGIRFQDAWKELNIREIRDIACHPEILVALKILFGRDPFPFQTLNFPTGSKQHFHSDAVHFSSQPEGFMCGVWIALEDIHPDSGCLEYYPGSHKEPYLSSQSIGLNSSEVEEAKAPQKFFEIKWRELVKHKNYKCKKYIPKKGDLLVWHANLLHGGSRIKNPSLTRWSQVSHYYFYGCEYNSPFYKTTDKINQNLFNRVPLDLLKLYS